MGLSEYQQGMVTDAFRQALEKAFGAGVVFVTTDIYPYADGSKAPDFDDWFEGQYGAILVEGEKSPASEKMSEKDELEILDGLGNLISRHEFEIPPYFGDQYY